MNKKRIVIFLALFAILGLGNLGILTVIPMSGQNGGTLAPFGTLPSSADAGDLVRNPYFDGAWQNDWVSSVVGTDMIVKQQSVSTHAERHNLDWFTCETHIDENFASSATSRDDGSLSFEQGVPLTKEGSGTSSFLRYQAHLYSSGYAQAQAGDSTDVVCSDSEASVSWSFDDTVTYKRQITQDLNNFGETLTLTYAVFSGKYKMLSTMSGSEVWHAKVTFKLQNPLGEVVQTATNYFESQALNGVEQSFDQDVLAFMQGHNGVYKYIIEFEFSMNHDDARSDSDSGNDGATAVTPVIAYDDYVSIDFYSPRLVYTTTLAPPQLNPISPSPDTDGNVVLSWNRVYGATQYLIYRNNTAAITNLIGQTLVHTVTSGDTTTWTDTTAVRGDNWYVVVAYDTTNYSPISECRNVMVILKSNAVTLTVPVGTDDDGEFSISWTSGLQATGYKVYMETSSFSSLDGLTPIATTGSLSYTVGPVYDGTYYFAVIGTNEAGDGPISNVESKVVLIINPPAAPTWVTSAPTVYQNYAYLDWNPALGAWNYTVYRNGTPIITTRLTNFTNYNLEDGKIYEYRVSASNYKGEGAQNAIYSVTCNIPNFFDKIGEWMNTLDPMVYNIISKGVKAILGETGGQDLMDYLNGQTGKTVTFNFELGIGEYEITAGVKLKLDLQMTLILTDSHIRAIIVPITNTNFNLANMAFGTSFGSIAEVMNTLGDYGVTITPSMYIAGKIDFQIALAEPHTITVNELAIEFKPKVVATLNVLKCILTAVAPEAEPVVSTIASLIDKFTGYDIYDIITAQITITLDVIVRYYPASDKVVLDIVLDIKLDAIRINFAQPRKNDHYEMQAGIVGQAGVHWETDTDLTWCGQLYFFLVFDFQDVKISLVRNLLQQAVTWTGLSYEQENKYYLIGPETACNPISLKGLHTAGGIDEDNDYVDDSVDPDATLPDADGDGLWDYLELNIGSLPLVVDTDNDGLTDSEEYNLGTDPSQADTDGDGLADADEELNLGTNPCSVDTDGDILNDTVELAEGTDPLVADTDADGFSDGWEVYWYDTDPLSPASVPADADSDTLPNQDEMYLFQTNPNYRDNEDSDGDGLTNAAENIFYGSSPYLADTDDDGLNDNIEVANGIYFLDPDSDQDRLLDGEEYLSYHTDPKKQDTDADGYTDYLEIVLGSDPLNYYSNPEEFKIVDYATVYAFLIGAAVAAGALFGVWAFQRYFGNPLRGLKLRSAASNAMSRASRRIRGKPVAPKALPEGVQGPAEKEPSPMELKAKSKLHKLKKSKKAKGFWSSVQG